MTDNNQLINAPIAFFPNEELMRRALVSISQETSLKDKNTSLAIPSREADQLTSFATKPIWSD